MLREKRNNRFRKNLIIISTIFAIFAIMKMNVCMIHAEDAEESKENYKDGFVYEILDDGAAMITKCAVVGDVIIPASIDGHIVKKLKKELFLSDPYITSVSLPATVEAPGDFDYWFSYAENLKSIYVDENNPYIASKDGVYETEKIA